MMEKINKELANWAYSRRRKTNMAIGITAVLLCEVARAYYRPFIYSNEINDFHIADTLGNSLGTVGTVFVFVSLLGHSKTQEHFLIRTTVISVLVYEVAHPLLGKLIDPWDLIATIIAGFFCEGLYRVIHERKQQEIFNSDTFS
jgi:hypothetical protein